MNGFDAARCAANEQIETFLSSPGAGGGTVRVGATVRRVPSKAPKLMRYVLEHLESVEFAGAPRYLGQDSLNRAILTYIPGQVCLPPYKQTWMTSDELLVSVGRLLREFHEAMASFCLRADMQVPHPHAGPFDGNLIGHFDVSMANVVCRDSAAVALIDFEEVGAAAHIWDIARAARHWVPLMGNEDIRQAGLGALAGRQQERLAAFAGAYELSQSDCSIFVEAALANADHSYERMRQGAKGNHPGYSAEWVNGHAARNRRARRWIAQQSIELAAALRSS